MIRSLLFITVLLGIFSSFCAGGKAVYDKKTVFEKDLELQFPDFKLKFLGTRSVTSERFASGFTFYDFSIGSAALTRTVSWSSGTGDIGPVEFDVDGARFQLELRFSDRLGRLAENEIVITKKQARR